jgi:hypothetical protein
MPGPKAQTMGKRLASQALLFSPRTIAAQKHAAHGALRRTSRSNCALEQPPALLGTRHSAIRQLDLMRVIKGHQLRHRAAGRRNYVSAGGHRWPDLSVPKAAFNGGSGRPGWQQTSGKRCFLPTL